MARGKTINVFMMDGEITGRIKCTIGNWIGVVYKVPRTAMGECTGIEHLRQSGIYFLIGTDRENYDPMVYVGQAGVRKNGKGLLFRVSEPHNSIDWTEAIMLTTLDDSFGPTEMSYLENRFCNLALEAGRYRVTNANEPNPGNVTEETQSELDEFIDYTKIILDVLAHKVFEPQIPQTLEFEMDLPLLYMAYGQGKATGRRTSEGFVVYKGSVLNPQITNSCPNSVKKLRNQYADSIVDNILIADIPLSSPSAAAGFIGGASLNGNTAWKDANGVALRDIE